MVSSRKKKHQSQKQTIQLNEIFSDFVIGNNTNAEVIENETSEPQTNSVRFGIGEHSASQDQVFEKNFAVKIRKVVVNARMTVKNRVYAVKVPRAKLPANTSNFTCSSQVKRPKCSLPVETWNFTFF